MNEDLHSEDEPFKKAYEHSEESPSSNVWDNINAELDRQDAIYYRRRMITWKRVACLLLLLSGGYAVYKNFIIKNEVLLPVVYKSKSVKQDTQTIIYPSLHPKNSFTRQEDNGNSTTRKEDHDKQNIRHTIPFHRNHHPDNNNNTESLAVIEVQHDKKIPESKLTIQQKISLSSSLAIKKGKPDSNHSNRTFHNQTESLQISNFPVDATKNNSIVDNNNQQTETTIEGSHQHEMSLQKDKDSIVLNSTDSAKHDLPTSQLAKRIKVHPSFIPKWSFTPYLSADFTQYHLDDDDNNPLEDKDDIEEREKHEFSFSGGILAKWQYCRKIAFKTGLIYSNIGIGIQPQTLHAEANSNQGIAYKFITSSGYAYVKPVFSSSPAAGDSISASVSQHHLQYVSVPLMMNYILSEGKHFSIQSGAGISANILLSTKVRTEIEDASDKEFVIINKLTGLRPVYTSFVADAQMEYSIGNHTSITLLPQFKYALNPITKNNVVKTYPYSFSLGAGISYRF